MGENSEKLQAVFRQMEKQWKTPTSEASKAQQKSVKRLQKGETLYFVYHELSNREPVDQIIFEAKAVGQQDLGLYVEPTIHVWIPGIGKNPTKGIDR